MKKALLVVVTGDKGLAGAFNTNVIRRARQEVEGHRRARPDAHRPPRRRLLPPAHAGASARPTPPCSPTLSYEAAAAIAREIAEAFERRDYDAVYVVYNQFVSVITQKLTFERLLPLEAARGAPQRPPPRTATPRAEGRSARLHLRASASEILDRVVPSYVSTQIHRILLDSQAAFFAAQMTAMEAATKNAGELIDRYKLRYNRSRQAAITKELIEIVSGADALQG